MKHTMPWFKLWSEARNDPKLRALTDAQFRIWFNLLCFAAEQAERGAIDASDMEYLAVEVADGNTEALEATITRLEKFHIVEWNEDHYLTFCNFKKRQYEKPSDDPERVAERVRQHRERNKNDGNAHVTPSNTHVTPGNAMKRTEEEGETDPETDPPGKGNKKQATENTQGIDQPTRVRARIESSSPTSSLAQRVQDACGLYSVAMVELVEEIAEDAAAANLDLVKQARRWAEKKAIKHEDLTTASFESWMDKLLHPNRPGSTPPPKRKMKRLTQAYQPSTSAVPERAIPVREATGPPRAYHRLKVS